MIPRQDPPPALLRLASLQTGVLSTPQIIGHGYRPEPVRRLLATGAWSRLATGIVFTRPGEPPWEALAWGGVLAGGDRSRLGYTAAGFVYDLVERAPEPIRVLVPRSNARSRPGPWEFVSERPGARSDRSPGSPPRTTVEDTVLDLVAESEERHVINLVTRAIQRRLTTAARLRAAAGRRSRLRYRKLLGDLLADVAAGAESPLELAYLRDVERAHRLPAAGRQIRRLRYCTDVRYEAYATLVELDGRLGHDGGERFRDMWRDNAFALEDQITLRYGWQDVWGRACEVAYQVGAVLSRRGWTGLIDRCPNCRYVIGTDLVA